MLKLLTKLSEHVYTVPIKSTRKNICKTKSVVNEITSAVWLHPECCSVAYEHSNLLFKVIDWKLLFQAQ